jgi:hypothetical protein
MSVRPVDLRGAIVADLAKGNLRSRDDRPLLALPVDGLSIALAEGGPAATRALGAALGAALEAPAREALSDGLDAASPQDVAYAVNAALARFGLGRVSFEQWGDALVARWHDAPSNVGPLAELSAFALARCLSSLLGADVSAAVIGHDERSLRVIVAHESVCAHVRSKPNASVAEIVADLRVESAS